MDFVVIYNHKNKCIFIVLYETYIIVLTWGPIIVGLARIASPQPNYCHWGLSFFTLVNTNLKILNKAIDFFSYLPTEIKILSPKFNFANCFPKFVWGWWDPTKPPFRDGLGCLFNYFSVQNNCTEKFIVALRFIVVK